MSRRTKQRGISKVVQKRAPPPPPSVPIVSSGLGGYFLETQNIKEVFSGDDIANAKVAIISMCGAMQCGKSLMLNYFYEYLMCSEAATNPKSSTPPKKCFDWANGLKNQKKTFGIHITRKPVFIPRDEENIAVFLMDSEGINVNNSSKVTQLIYALVTLFSSVQIINVEKDLKDVDLHPLNAFMSAYDGLKDYNEQKAVFESKLLFLVRDFVYGNKGEENYLSQAFRNGQKKTRKSELYGAFSNIGCFLMPQPGRKATAVPKIRNYTKNTTQNEFNGLLRDFNESFRTALAELMSLVFKNLLLKTVNGMPIRCRQFPEYIKLCFSTLTGCDDLREGLQMVVTQSRFQALFNESITTFQNSLKIYSSEIAIEENEFVDMCEKEIEKVLKNLYPNETSISLSDDNAKYRNKLQKELQKIVKKEKENAENFFIASTQAINKAISKCKKTYEKELQSEIDRGIADQKTFEDSHKTAINDALALFDRAHKQGGESFVEKSKSNLEAIIHEIYDSKLKEMIFEEDALGENIMEKKITIGECGGKIEHEACILEFRPGTFFSEAEISFYVQRRNEPDLPDKYVWKSPTLHFESSDQHLLKSVKCKIPCWYITFSDEVEAEKIVFILQKSGNKWIKIGQDKISHKAYISCKLKSLSPIRLAWSSDDKPRRIATILYQSTCGNFVAKFFNMAEMSIIKETAKTERYLTVSDLNTIEVSPSDEVEVLFSVVGCSNSSVRRFVAKDIFSHIRSEQFLPPSVQDDETPTTMQYAVNVNGCSKISIPFSTDLNNPGRPDTTQAGPFNFTRTDARGDNMRLAIGPVETNY